jgi:hypothetical protein
MVSRNNSEKKNIYQIEAYYHLKISKEFEDKGENFNNTIIIQVTACDFPKEDEIIKT